MSSAKKLQEYSSKGHPLEVEKVEVFETATGELATRSNSGVQIVFPPDKRQRVTDTTKFPWRSMGQLLMEFPNGKRYTGTATLIDGSHLLTAAHNVYGKDIGGFATKVWYVPGRDGDVFPYGVVAGKKLFITEDYFTKSPADPNATPDGTVEDYTHYTEDYAVVRLEQPLRLPILGMYPASNTELKEREANVTGYPGDKAPPDTMWTAHKPLSNGDDHFLFYKVDTYKGESGAGVVVDLGMPVGVTLVGVHVAGSVHLDTNFAVRLTSSHIKTILSWMKME